MSSKNIEDLLRERLGAPSSQPLPSPGFEERVRRSLTTRGTGSRRRTRLLAGLVGLAAVVALAIAAAPWVIGPRSGSGPVGGATPGVSLTAEPTVEPTVSPTSVPLAHAQEWHLSFDYPPAWTLVDRNIPAATLGLNASSATQGDVFGFVGNGGASEKCVPAAPPVNTCTTTWSLAAGTIVLRFEDSSKLPSPSSDPSVRPSYLWTAEQATLGPEVPGAEALTIDGLPARFAKSTTDVIPYSQETVPGATEVLWWGLTSQQQFFWGYSIVAAIRGPNAASLEAQAKALVAGIHYVPDTAMLPTDPTALGLVRQAALERALADQKKYAGIEHVHAWDCFPSVVGASQDATITQTPLTSPLTLPLPVTCTVESMVPTAMQGWMLTLSQSWAAGSDYPAGKAHFFIVMTGDGQTWATGTADAKDAQPAYPHVGTSKIPG